MSMEERINDDSNQKVEEKVKPTTTGTFMDKYRERFGPDIQYQSGVTSYTLSNGFLYLDGRPIRKLR